MKDIVEYERPNTVAGLIAKHAELSALRDKYKSEIRTMEANIQHLAATIRLFDPAVSVYPLRGTVERRRAKRGALKRYVLNTLREAPEALTSRELTMGWGADQGLDVTEEVYPDLRRKVSSCIKDCVKGGLVEATGRRSEPEQSGFYKLWALKKGDQ